MTKKRWMARLFFSLFLCLGGCSATGQDNQEKRDVAKAGKRPATAVEVVKVAASSIEDGIDVVGSLAFKFETDVRSEYTGIVTDVYVTEWVQVKKGTPLAKLDTREGAVVLKKAETAVEVAKANLMQAEVAANRANREYERLLKLKEAGLVTQQNLDDGLTEKEAAAARIAAAQGQIKAAEDEVLYVKTKLSKTLILAPVDGTVSLRNVNVGDFVGEMGAKAMFKVVDDQLLDLILAVPSTEMEAVKVGQALLFSTDALPGKTFRGKIRFINPGVNETDRSVKVTAEVENMGKQLKGGLFVKGRIMTGKRTGVLKLPRSALITWDMPGKKGELFVIRENMAQRRTVQIGGMAEGSVEISSGIVTGDLVITRGGFNVKDGAPVNIIRINGEK
ncbi:MAG: efflux RND transporter periplasmic adaptor subunit [Deltaproteobacteria bacterium]|nr:efflux RND transporter periplasmic adaptor subunit [Deltaproteobacteria bacterium]